MEQITIPIKGMHCASCALTIEKTLKKVDGVQKCDVNYGTEKAKIEFDPTVTSIKNLSSKIEPFGYSLNTHVMPDGSVMSESEHAAHLGLNQSKEEKIKEINSEGARMKIVMPITFIVFALMIWQMLAMNIQGFPSFIFQADLFNKISLIIATIIIFWIGKPYVKGVISFLKYRNASMDTLVGIGTITAYAYSTIILLFPEVRESLKLGESLYFDATVVVLGFITFGKYLEARSKLKTGEAIEKLLNLQAKTALVERDGKELEVSIEEVSVNEIIIIKPGGKIPVDGVIIEGSSSIDESMITGESIPVDKQKNDTVIGGTLNKQGAFKFKATKIGSETLLAHIIKMVEDAQGSRAPIQRLADQISGIFVPVVLIIAFLTLVGWLVIGSQTIGLSQAFSIGITSFVGVLVIACPCALGLATPTAIIVGTGKGAENGILIKDAESLEKLHKVNTIVTDKTGTITKGQPEVTDILVNNTSFSKEEILKLLASLENRSEHPLAVAIVNKFKETNDQPYSIDSFSIIEGKGLKGKINDEMYYAGNIKLMNDLKIKFDQKSIDELSFQGKTPIFFTNSKELIATIGIADTLKENALETINALHKLGIKVVMLTGDNKNTAKYIAKQVGIDEVIAEVLPNEKSEKVKELQQKGSIVAMIGDGVNDAPALAQADIGIAMGTGTDVAIESAQITLLAGDFSKVLKAIKLSKFTMRAIKQNLFWAFVYNIIGIPLAALGLLSPVFAGAAMAFSSVSVVGNSLRLKLKQL